MFFCATDHPSSDRKLRELHLPVSSAGHEFIQCLFQSKLHWGTGSCSCQGIKSHQLGSKSSCHQMCMSISKNYILFPSVFQCVACLCIHSREYMGKWLPTPQENSFCRAEPQSPLILGVVLSHCEPASVAGMYPSPGRI